MKNNFLSKTSSAWLSAFFIVVLSNLCAAAPVQKQEQTATSTTPANDGDFKSTLPIVDKKLSIGWVAFDPYYILIKSEGGLERLAGLDAELVRAITKAAGYKADYKFIAWGTQVQNLRDGEQHFAAAATYTAEREKFVYFSDAYRREENSFYTRKGYGYQFSFKNGDMQGFKESIKKNKSKIAVLDGMVFASPEINKFVNNPENKKYLVPTKDVYESIDLLLRGTVDGFLDDRVLSSTAIWRTKNSDKIEEVYLGIGTPIHLMFSKKAISPSVVKEINTAIKSIKSDGTYAKVVSEYLLPVLILQTIERPWFFFLEAFAIMALVLSGLLIAYREKFNLYGTMLLAFVSMSGGIIRDVFVNRPKLGILLTPIYALGIFALVMMGFVAVWLYQLLIQKKDTSVTSNNSAWDQRHTTRIRDWLIEILDAFGLAAYTVTGVIVALISQLDPLWLWGPIMAVITTTGGGILRDIIRGEKDIPSLKSDFYGEIAIIWGLTLSLALTWDSEMMSPETMFRWVIFVVAGNFITRILVKFLGFKGVPFNLKDLG